MNRLQLLVHEVIQNIDMPVGLEERKKLEEIINQIFVEKKLPKDALGLSEETLEHLYAQGYRLYNNGNYKAAKDVFKVLNVYNPRESRYAGALGATFHRLKNYRDACEYYLAAAILDPQDPLPFYYMFDCYNQAGMLTEAEGCLLETIRRMGEDPIYAKLKIRCTLLLEGVVTTIKQYYKEGKLVASEAMLEEDEAEIVAAQQIAEIQAITAAEAQPADEKKVSKKQNGKEVEPVKIAQPVKQETSKR